MGLKGIRSTSIEASNLEAEVLEYWLSDCVCWLQTQFVWGLIFAPSSQCYALVRSGTAQED